MSALQVLQGIALILCSTIAAAEVTITGTRIIYPSTAKSISVQLNNVGTKPALIQTWIDDGDPKVIPDSSLIPFVLTPSLTRIEAKKGQKIRMIAKGMPVLPMDKESVFWLNILDIPPSAQESDGANKLRISIRSRIKVFYRPKDLKISQADAFKGITFKYIENEKAVEISNPSPYFITFNKFTYSSVGAEQAYSTSLMVAPFSSEKLPQSELNLKLNTELVYEVINDSGGLERFPTIIK